MELVIPEVQKEIIKKFIMNIFDQVIEIAEIFCDFKKNKPTDEQIEKIKESGLQLLSFFYPSEIISDLEIKVNDSKILCEFNINFAILRENIEKDLQEVLNNNGIFIDGEIKEEPEKKQRTP